MIMNEIKEILDNVKKCCNIMEDNNFVVCQRQDILKILDYITNLQEVSNMFKESFETMSKNYFEEKSKNEILKKDYGRLIQDNAYTLELEQRNEKAIEYMSNYIEVEDAPINERIKTEFKEVIRLLTGGDK